MEFHSHVAADIMLRIEFPIRRSVPGKHLKKSKQLIDSQSFPTRWKDFAWSTSAQLTLCFWVIITFFSLFQYLANTSNPISISVIMLLYVCAPFFATTFSFTFSLTCKLHGIKINDKKIEGRDIWGRKKQIPLTKITELRPFSNRGVNATIVDSKRHGHVLIYEYTERHDELLRLVSSHLPPIPPPVYESVYRSPFDLASTRSLEQFEAVLMTKVKYAEKTKQEDTIEDLRYWIIDELYVHMDQEDFTAYYYLIPEDHSIWITNYLNEFGRRVIWTNYEYPSFLKHDSYKQGFARRLAELSDRLHLACASKSDSPPLTHS